MSWSKNNSIFRSQLLVQLRDKALRFSFRTSLPLVICQVKPLFEIPKWNIKIDFWRQKLWCKTPNLILKFSTLRVILKSQFAISNKVIDNSKAHLEVANCDLKSSFQGHILWLWIESLINIISIITAYEPEVKEKI